MRLDATEPTEDMQEPTCPSCESTSVRTKVNDMDQAVFTCRKCGLSFGVFKGNSPPFSFDNYWWTAKLTQKFSQYVECAEYSLRHKLAVLKQLGAGTASVRSMLDVGCGNGAFLAAGERLGIASQGTDLDRENVRFAQEHGFNAHHCDLQKFDPQVQFDFIHIKGTLHLVPNPRILMRRVAELVSPGGYLYIDSIHQDGLASCSRKLLAKLGRGSRYGQIHPPIWHTAYTKRSMTFLLQRGGFVPLKYLTFSRGNRRYYPVLSPVGALSVIGPLLDPFGLGGDIGCYARRSVAAEFKR